jgi:hypothetical protein
MSESEWDDFADRMVVWTCAVAAITAGALYWMGIL